MFSDDVKAEESPDALDETKGAIVSATSVSRSAWRARPGDRLIIRGHRLRGTEPDGEILDVLGDDGLPPYVVRWSDDGHVSTLFPGQDAFIEHFEPRRIRHRTVTKRHDGKGGEEAWR